MLISFHNRLIGHFSAYHHWHARREHKFWHWFVVGVVSTLSLVVIFHYSPPPDIGEQALTPLTRVVHAEAPGLVAAYAFDEGSGATAADASGNGHTGTLSNVSWTSLGHTSNAVSFPGTAGVNNYCVQVGDFSSLVAPMTIEFWFNLSATPNSNMFFVRPPGYGGRPTIRFANSGGWKLLAVLGAEKYVYSSQTFSDADIGMWHHFAFVGDTASLLSNWKIYIDGIDRTGVKGNNSGTIDPFTTQTCFGGGYGNGNYQGLLDDVRFYGIALTQSDIQTDMNTPLSGSPPPSDTAPPVLSNGAPSGSLAQGTTQTTISLMTDENATCKYSTTAGTSYASMSSAFSTTGSANHSTPITGLADGQSYTYYVRCQDTSNNPNISDYPISFSVASSTPSDTTPPTVSITTPANNATVSGNVTITANASDNVGVTGVTFFYDLVNQIADILTAPFTTLWNTAAITNGIHTLTARVRDAAGLQTTSSVVSVTVSNASSGSTTYYIDNSCATNGNGRAATCATTSGGNGAWNAMSQLNCGLTVPGDIIEIRSRGGTARSRRYLGRWFALERAACAGTAVSPLIVQNYANEDVVMEGTFDIRGNTWTDRGNGLWECTSGTNCGVSGQQVFFAAWYTKPTIAQGAEQRVTLTRQSVSDCASSGIGTNEMAHLTGTSGNLCVRLPDGSSPATTEYFDIPWNNSWMEAWGTMHHYVTLRKNPAGGSWTIRRFRNGILSLGNSNNIGWTIDGLTMGWIYDRCIATVGPGPLNLTVRNSIIEYCGQEGIRPDTVSGGTTLIENNEIRYIQHSSVFIGCNTGAPAAPCRKSYDNGTPIRLADSVGITVRGNVIHDVGGGNGGNGRSRAIDLEGGGSNHLIENNYIYRQNADLAGGDNQRATAAIRFSGATGFGNLDFGGNIIRNNRMYDVENCFLWNIASGATPTTAPSYIYNNSCVDFRNAGLLRLGGGTWEATGAWQIKNNLFADSSTLPAQGIIQIPAGSGSAFNVSTLRYNAYFCEGCASGTQIVMFNGATANANAASVQALDPNSQYGDPNLGTSGSPPTLKMLSASGSAYDKGATLAGFSTDFEGDTRPQGSDWDIGADEYVAATTGNVYYVATTGNDTNPGTQSQPWRTIGKAANTVIAGDTVLIRGGVYNEKVTLSRSGQAGQIITFQSYPGEKAIINGTGVTLSASDGLIFFSANTSYVTLVDVEVRNATADGIISLRPSNITIQNVDVHDNGGGIRFNCQNVNARSDSRVTQSKSHHNQQEGILIRNCPGGYFTIENNEIYNNVGTGNYDGIEIYDTPYVAVLNNTIRDNCGPGGPPCGGDSIDAGGTNALVSPSHHLIYQGNTVSGPADVAVKMNNEPLYSIIRRNTLNGTGFVFYEGPSKIAVYHNTVVNSGEAVQFWGNGDNVSGLNFGGTQVKNNLFVDATGYVVNIGNQAVPDISSMLFDSNLYKFLAGNSSGINVNGPNNYNRTFAPNAAGLVNFNTALAQEPNGRVTTQTQIQLFTNSVAGDYTLLNGSAAIDTGRPLTTVTSQTNPTTFVVENSWYFQDGWGGLLTPDTIRVGSQDVQVASVDYQTHTITVAQSITATAGIGVSLSYSGSAPDIGVFEYTGSEPPPPVAFDFSLSAPGSVSVSQGISATATITATLTSGTPASLNFSASGLPTGVTASFSPTSCSPNCSTTITLSASPSAAIGSTPITISATSPSLVKTTTLTLVISDTSAPTFTTTPTSSSTTSIATTISFATNEPTTVTIDYGVTSQYGQTVIGQATPQTTHSLTLTNLQSGTTYHYRVKVKDASNNEASSLNQTFTTLPPVDTTAPSPITDLRLVSATPTSLNLTWTSSGDDATSGQAASYNLRYSAQSITEANFSSATKLTGFPTPKPAGAGETYTAIGLNPSTAYYLALKATDDAGLTSTISNILQAQTTSQPPPSGGGGGGGSVYIPDTTPPAKIANLTIQAADSEVRLTWTNPSDLDYVRTIIVRKTGSAPPASITDGTLVYEGTATFFIDTNLANNQPYSYSLFALDMAGNYSAAMSPSAGAITPTLGADLFNTSQNAALWGLITVDRLNGSPLANAALTLKTTQTTLTTTTDSSGRYRFNNLLPGSYTLSITSPNHHSYSPPSLVLAASETQKQDYYLKKLTAPQTVIDLALSKRLAGRILLQVQQKGEAWYVNPLTLKRHYLGRPADAFRIMREQGLGITDRDLSRVPEAGRQGTFPAAFRSHVPGRILLQVQSHGEAWYVNPTTLKRHYLGRPADAFRIMREQGLGITDSDLEKILTAD